MKNLKMIIFVLVVLLSTQLLVAQAKPTFIIRGGLSSASQMAKDDDDTYSKIGDNRIGFSLGATMEYPINEMFDFETGLLLSMKGSKRKEGGATAELSPIYLEIPVGVKHIRPLNDDLDLYGTAGIYLGYGIAGKAKVEISGLGSHSESIEWGSSDNSDLKPFDLGGNLGIGVIYDRYEAGLYSSTSILSIAPNSDDGFSVRNFVIGLMVGYRL